MKHNIEIKKIPYNEIIESTTIDNKSLYTMQENPYHNDSLTSGVIEGLVDGVIGGQVYIFPTLLCLKKEFVIGVSGTTLSVSKEYRKYEFGITIPETMVNSAPACLIAGVSKEAQPVYRYLGMKFFDMSRYVFIVNSHFIVEKKIQGVLGKIISLIIDTGLHAIYRTFQFFFKLKYGGFNVVERKIDEIDYEGIKNIMDADKHPYREEHDKRWIKWVMNYHDTYKESQQHFYEVYKNDKLVGFFLNKNKFRPLMNGRYKNVVYGTILEWGSIDQNVLSDADLCVMAFSRFGMQTDAIAMICNEDHFFNKIPKWARKKMGNLNYAVKLDKEKYPDFKEEKNWRIRPAGGDASF